MGRVRERRRHYWREHVTEAWSCAYQAWWLRAEAEAIGYATELAEFKAKDPTPRLGEFMVALSPGWSSPFSSSSREHLAKCVRSAYDGGTETGTSNKGDRDTMHTIDGITQAARAGLILAPCQDCGAGIDAECDVDCPSQFARDYAELHNATKHGRVQSYACSPLGSGVR